MNTLKKYALPLGMFLIFETVAIALWLTLDNIYYFFNFMNRSLSSRHMKKQISKPPPQR